MQTTSLKKYLLSSLMIISLSLSSTLNAQTNSGIFSSDTVFPDLDQETKEDFFGDNKVIFHDKNIIVKVPSFADNPAQVPIFVDASYYKKGKRIIVFADLNLIKTILDMQIIDFVPTMSMNIKVAQATPLRVAVLDENDVWHVATADIQSEGGGCSVAPNEEKDKEKLEQLGKYRSKVSQKKDGYDLKFSIYHPMETGLFFGKSEFYINDLQIKENNKTLVKIETSAAVSENPRFEFKKMQGNGNYTIIMNDTDGNNFTIKPKK